MNKKLLLGAALLVGMGTTFTSCVDSTESPSVTAIREAKAEQLKSIAEYNKALAEKELILANADKATQEAQQALAAAQAAYLQAQAEYQKAQAAYMNAQAALLNAQTDAEKAKLEYELKLMQANLDRQAQDLEAAKAELAYRQQQYQLQLEQLQAQIELQKINIANAWWQYDQMVKAAQKAEEEAEKQAILDAAENIKNLIDKYDTAYQNLIRAKYNLAEDQMTLARLEAGIEDQKNVANDEILKLQERNKYLEKEIAFEEGYINTYYKWMGEIVTQEMWDEALYNLVKSEVDIEEYEPTYDAAEKTADDALTALETSAYAASVAAVLNDNSGSYTEENEVKDRTETFRYRITRMDADDTDSNVPAECRGTYYLSVGHYISYGEKDDESDSNRGWVYTYTPVFTVDQTANEKLDNGDLYEVYTSYYGLVNDGAGLKAWLECKINTLQNQSDANNLKAAEKEYADATAYQKKAYEELGKAKTAYDTAKADTPVKQAAAEAARAKIQPAFEAYMEAASKLATNATDEEKAAVKALETAYDKARTDAATAATALQAADQKESETYATWQKWVSASDYADLWVQAAKRSLTAAQDGDTDNSDLVAYYKDLVDGIIAEEATNTDNIKAYNDASKAFAEVIAENDALYEANDAAYGEYVNLYFALLFGGGIVGGNSDANQLVMDSVEAIAAYEAEIAENEASIEQWQAAIDKYDSEEYYNEITLQAQKQIELDQAALATAQQLYDIAKAELDAALAEQQK